MLTASATADLLNLVASRVSEHPVVEGVSQLIYLIHDDRELRREGVQMQVRVGRVINIFKDVFHMVTGGYDGRSNGIVTYLHRLLVDLLPQGTLSFLGFDVETVLRGLPCRRPISRGTDVCARVSFYSNVC